MLRIPPRPPPPTCLRITGWGDFHRAIESDALSSPTRHPTVLVLDGAQRAALAVVRSLGSRQVQVHVGASGRRSLAGGSRHSRSESVLPDPLQAPERYSQAVAALATAIGATIVLPITEASHLALLERPDPLRGLMCPIGDLASFQRATDKALVRRLAEDSGIRVPDEWSFPPTGMRPPVPADAFPIVVKPRRSVHEAKLGRRQDSARYAHSQEELGSLLDRSAASGIELIGQRRISGPGIGVFLLRWNGRILARFAHRRIREKPPSGGVSVCCESIAVPDSLVAASAGLLERIGWNGVAMIEYKQDGNTGEDFLLEVNPRFWGSLQLSIDAGVDFPWLLLQAAIGDPEVGSPSWPVGVRSRWLLGELDHLIALATKSRRQLDLPPGAPGVVRTGLAIMNPIRTRQRFDVLRATDLGPAVRELTTWLRAAVRQRDA